MSKTLDALVFDERYSSWLRKLYDAASKDTLFAEVTDETVWDTLVQARVDGTLSRQAIMAAKDAGQLSRSDYEQFLEDYAKQEAKKAEERQKKELEEKQLLQKEFEDAVSLNTAIMCGTPLEAFEYLYDVRRDQDGLKYLSIGGTLLQSCSTTLRAWSSLKKVTSMLFGGLKSKGNGRLTQKHVLIIDQLE